MTTLKDEYLKTVLSAGHMACDQSDPLKSVL